MKKLLLLLALVVALTTGCGIPLTKTTVVDNYFRVWADAPRVDVKLPGTGYWETIYITNDVDTAGVRVFTLEQIEFFPRMTNLEFRINPTIHLNMRERLRTILWQIDKEEIREISHPRPGGFWRFDIKNRHDGYHLIRLIFYYEQIVVEDGLQKRIKSKLIMTIPCFMHAFDDVGHYDRGWGR